MYYTHGSTTVKGVIVLLNDASLEKIIKKLTKNFYSSCMFSVYPKSQFIISLNLIEKSIFIGSNQNSGSLKQSEGVAKRVFFFSADAWQMHLRVLHKWGNINYIWEIRGLSNNRFFRIYIDFIFIFVWKKPENFLLPTSGSINLTWNFNKFNH